MASAGSCKMRGIEGVGTAELVLVGGLLVVHAQKSVGDGLTGKGELDVWVVRVGT